MPVLTDVHLGMGLTPEMWDALGVIGAAAMTGFFAVLAAWLQGRATRQKLEEVKKLAEPVGNGFTGEVRAALADLKEVVGQVREKIDDHLQAHASADVARHNPRPPSPRRGER